MLRWDDLIVDDLTPEEMRQWLGEWSWLIPGDLRPVFLSKFGDWFLRCPDGSIQMLSVLEGKLLPIAASAEEFHSAVNSTEWQEKYFRSHLVEELHGEGRVPGRGKCYAFAPHPCLGGSIGRQQVIVVDIPVWQQFCSQFFRPSPRFL